MNKDIVFYSNFCSFSKEIVASLSKSAIHQSLVYICVDDKNINLPQFITVVPTIYISQERKILTDDEINKWIDSQNPKKEEDEDIMAYHGNSMGVTGFSTSFSFLEEDNENNIIAKYSFLDGPSAGIETPKEFNEKTGARGGMDKALEQLQQSRNSESFGKGVHRI